MLYVEEICSALSNCKLEAEHGLSLSIKEETLEETVLTAADNISWLIKWLIIGLPQQHFESEDVVLRKVCEDQKGNIYMTPKLLQSAPYLPSAIIFECLNLQ